MTNRSYVPEFNCFARRLVSLCGERGIEELRIPVVVWDGNESLGVLRSIEGRGTEAKVYYPQLESAWYWCCDLGAGSAGEIKLRRGIKGFHLSIGGEAFTLKELPDYWEDPH